VILSENKMGKEKEAKKLMPYDEGWKEGNSFVGKFNFRKH
jgi:hypothetical protein